MSFVIAVPEVLGTAAGSLAGIGSSITAANAAAETTGLLPAAQDGGTLSPPTVTTFSRSARGRPRSTVSSCSS
ncbi:PE family protein [Mycobacterium sp. HUMS_1102779]|uniref:PE family protein n=1 Tax=Mycobacterium sp. HUMS_1102779 TaxID=3383487 RepID=UPI00389B29F5